MQYTIEKKGHIIAVFPRLTYALEAMHHMEFGTQIFQVLDDGKRIAMTEVKQWRPMSRKMYARLMREAGR